MDEQGSRHEVRTRRGEGVKEGAQAFAYLKRLPIANRLYVQPSQWIFLAVFASSRVDQQCFCGPLTGNTRITSHAAVAYSYGLRRCHVRLWDHVSEIRVRISRSAPCFFIAMVLS